MQYGRTGKAFGNSLKLLKRIRDGAKNRHGRVARNTQLIFFGLIIYNEMSRVMRKQTFCICENKDADQLRGKREADQRLCFCYIDSIIPLLFKSEISSS